MLETIIDWDYRLFGLLNGWGPVIIDQFMILLSDKIIWIPLYLWVIFKITERYGATILWVLVAIVIAVALSDQLTSAFMKPYFERLRPCRDPLLSESVLIVSKCGGKYGFASSHAANTMALAFFCWLCLRNRFAIILMGWALLVGLSRVYLGVHFPGDVMAGAIIGIVAAWLSYGLLRYLRPAILLTSD